MMKICYEKLLRKQLQKFNYMDSYTETHSSKIMNPLFFKVGLKYYIRILRLSIKYQYLNKTKRFITTNNSIKINITTCKYKIQPNINITKIKTIE